MAFTITGLGYLLAPASILSIVGIQSAATSDFLIRTEGVALVSAAGFLSALRDGTPTQMRSALLALSVYFIRGSVVDLVAFNQGIVGAAAVPSGIIRSVIGGVCLVTTTRLE